MTPLGQLMVEAALRDYEQPMRMIQRKKVKEYSCLERCFIRNGWSTSPLGQTKNSCPLNYVYYLYVWEMCKCVLMQHLCGFSLVAPVESDGDVPLDVSALVLCQVTGQQLPSQVYQLHHHVANLVEQIHLVFLKDGERNREVSFTVRSPLKIHLQLVNTLIQPYFAGRAPQGRFCAVY